MSDIEALIRKIVREEQAGGAVVLAMVRETVARAFADVSRAVLSDHSMRQAVRAQAAQVTKPKIGRPPRVYPLDHPKSRAGEKARSGPSGPSGKKRKHQPRVSEKPANRLKQLFDKMKVGDEFTLTAGEIAKSLDAPVKAVAQALTQGAGLQKTRTGAAFPSNKPDGMEIVKGESSKTVGGAHRWTIRRTA